MNVTTIVYQFRLGFHDQTNACGITLRRYRTHQTLAARGIALLTVPRQKLRHFRFNRLLAKQVRVS
jgi:hypothetical protein